MNGNRDRNEVWRILYPYTDEFVKHTFKFSDRPSDYNIHLIFTIKEDGTVEKVTIPNSSKSIMKQMESFAEDIYEWNFRKGTVDVTRP
jgi:hypothetical protein